MSALPVWVYWSRVDWDEDGTRARQAALPALERAHAEGLGEFLRRRQFVASRTLMRQALSHRHAVDGGDHRPPDYWTFRRQDGRLVTDPVQTPWHLSLSHSDDRVALVLAPTPWCGIDLESLQRDPPWHDIARRYFHPSELAWLEGAPPSDQKALFLSLWTRKEACIKAWHTGIAHHLPTIRFGPEQDSPLDWPAAYADLPLQVNAWHRDGWLISAAVHSPAPDWRLQEWRLDQPGG